VKKILLSLVVLGAFIAIVAASCSGDSDKPAAPSVVHEGKSDDVTAAPPAEKTTPKPKSKPKALSDGTYKVGTDIKSGTYKTPGPGSTDILDSCYWSVNKDDLGEDIVANDNITGPARVTVKKGQYLELSGGCNWSRVVAK
jgi:hypothetical protein